MIKKKFFIWCCYFLSLPNLLIAQEGEPIEPPPGSIDENLGLLIVMALLISVYYFYNMNPKFEKK